MQIKSYDLTFISAGNYEYKEEMAILEEGGGTRVQQVGEERTEDVS